MNLHKLREVFNIFKLNWRKKKNLLWQGNKPNLGGKMAALMKENAGENSSKKSNFYRKKEISFKILCMYNA